MAFYILSRWKVKPRGLLALQSCWKKPTGLLGISYTTDSRECPTFTPVIRAAERRWGGKSWWALLSSRSLIVYKHLLGAWYTRHCEWEKEIGSSLCLERTVRWPLKSSPVKSAVRKTAVCCWWSQRGSPGRTCLPWGGPTLPTWWSPLCRCLGHATNFSGIFQSRA